MTIEDIRKLRNRDLPDCYKLSDCLSFCDNYPCKGIIDAELDPYQASEGVLLLRPRQEEMAS